MEVTKHGDTLRHCTCWKCGCEFSFLLKEIKKEKTEHPFNMNLITYEEVIHCPECNKKLFLKRSTYGYK